MHDHQPGEILLTAAQIQSRVVEMAAEIRRDVPDDLHLVAVLKGAFMFLADLARRLDGEVSLDFLVVSSYAKGTSSSGEIRLQKDLDVTLNGKNVVVVEDIVDTGLTLAYLTGQLRERGPRTLSTCALLDRPTRRIVPADLRYRGVVLDDQFVLGYGLHMRDLYRNLPFVAVGDRSLVAAEPEAYVEQLYGRNGR